MKSEEVNKVLLVAQEITFAKALSGNDKHLRERALRKLKKWLHDKSIRGEKFTEESFMRIWKGLFYCVWMSDKPLIQESTAEEVSQLIHCFSKFAEAQMFVRCFYQAISQAWFGLDQHRLDKFMMLVRRCLRQMFEFLNKQGWKKKQVLAFTDDLYKALKMAPIGMNLHLIEIYLEELSKVGRGKLKSEIVSYCVKPFATFMSEQIDIRIITHIAKHIFLYLIRQSDTGIKHQLKFQAWREAGFPGGNIDVMTEVNTADEKGEEGEEDIMSGEETPLDPRAGSVDVFLPPIAFEPQSIIQLLHQLRSKKDTTTKARKTISSLINKFSKLKSGDYPLGLKTVELPEEEDEDEIITAAAERLQKEFNDNSQNRKKKTTLQNHRKENNWKISEVSVDSNKENKVASVTGNWNVTDISSLPQTLKRKNAEDNSGTSKKLKSIHSPKRDKSSNTKTSKNLSLAINRHKSKHKLKKKVKLLKSNGIDCNINSVNQDEQIDINDNTPVREKLNIKTKVEKESTLSLSTEQNAIENNLRKSLTTPKRVKDSSGKATKESSTSNTPVSAKKVAFVLNRNTAQEENEYKRNLKKRPSLPYDADKKPVQGVLKPSPVASPINPFYRHIIKPMNQKLS